MTKHSSCNRKLSPQWIAEDLCGPCVRTALQKGAVDTPARQIVRAWRFADLALISNQPVSQRSSLKSADSFLNKALAQKATPQQHNSARILKSVLPAFVDRAADGKVSESSKRRANEGFGGAIVERFGANIFHNTGWAVEALVLYLMSREGMPSEDFFFPGSPREEQSQQKRLNHDMYKLWPDGSGRPSKFPVQLKLTKNGGQYDVPILEVKPILQPVLTAIGADSLDPVFSMVALETSGRSGSYQETTLDFAGHCLQSAVTSLMYQRIITDFA